MVVPRREALRLRGCPPIAKSDFLREAQRMQLADAKRKRYEETNRAATTVQARARGRDGLHPEYLVGQEQD